MRYLLVATGLLSASLAAQDEAVTSQQLLNRATELHRAGKVEEAVSSYEAFLERQPKLADVRSNLGAAYVHLGLYEDAIRQYERALELGNASDPTLVRFNLALAYHKAAYVRQAIEALLQVLAARPEHSNAAMLLANYYLSADRNQEVIDLLSPFQEKLGADRAFSYLLGTALLREGDVERGQVLIDQLLRDGDSAEARFLLGTAYLEKDDPMAAAVEFERAIELNPELPSLNSFLGKTLSQLSRVDEAAEYFRRELAINPNDFDANLHLGMHLQKAEQRYGDALAHYQRALQVRPGSPNARYQIATVYLLTDRTPEALQLIEAVVRDVPDFLEGHATLVRLYYREGRRADAQRHRQIVDRLQAARDAEARAIVAPHSE